MQGTLPPRPGLRERKKAETRAALHRAARDLVEERGLANVTVEAVAEAADVSVRTFFNYFASKEEAVLGWDQSGVAQVADGVRAGIEAGRAPLDALQSALTELVYTEAITSSGLKRRMALVQSEPLLLSASFAHWEQMSSAMAAAIPTDAAYADLVVRVAAEAVRTALRHWSAGDGRDPLQRDLKRAISAAFDAIRTGLPAPTPTPHKDTEP